MAWRFAGSCRLHSLCAWYYFFSKVPFCIQVDLHASMPEFFDFHFTSYSSSTASSIQRYKHAAFLPVILGNSENKSPLRSWNKINMKIKSQADDKTYLKSLFLGSKYKIYEFIYLYCFYWVTESRKFIIKIILACQLPYFLPGRVVCTVNWTFSVNKIVGNLS